MRSRNSGLTKEQQTPPYSLGDFARLFAPIVVSGGSTVPKDEVGTPQILLVTGAADPQTFDGGNVTYSSNQAEFDFTSTQQALKSECENALKNIIASSADNPVNLASATLTSNYSLIKYLQTQLPYQDRGVIQAAYAGLEYIYQHTQNTGPNQNQVIQTLLDVSIPKTESPIPSLDSVTKSLIELGAVQENDGKVTFTHPRTNWTIEIEPRGAHRLDAELTLKDAQGSLVASGQIWNHHLTAVIDHFKNHGSARLENKEIGNWRVPNTGEGSTSESTHCEEQRNERGQLISTVNKVQFFRAQLLKSRCSKVSEAVDVSAEGRPKYRVTFIESPNYQDSYRAIFDEHSGFWSIFKNISDGAPESVNDATGLNTIQAIQKIQQLLGLELQEVAEGSEAVTIRMSEDDVYGATVYNNQSSQSSTPNAPSVEPEHSRQTGESSSNPSDTNTTNTPDEGQSRIADFERDWQSSLRQLIGEDNFKSSRWNTRDFNGFCQFQNITIGGSAISIDLKGIQSKSEVTISVFKDRTRLFDRNVASDKVIDEIRKFAASAFRAQVFEEVLQELQREYPAAGLNINKEQVDNSSRWVLSATHPKIRISYGQINKPGQDDSSFVIKDLKSQTVSQPFHLRELKNQLQQAAVAALTFELLSSWQETGESVYLDSQVDPIVVPPISNSPSGNTDNAEELDEAAPATDDVPALPPIAELPQATRGSLARRVIGRFRALLRPANPNTESATESRPVRTDNVPQDSRDNDFAQPLDEGQSPIGIFEADLQSSLTERIGEGNFTTSYDEDDNQTLVIRVGKRMIKIELNQFQNNEDLIIFRDAESGESNRPISAARAEVIDKIGDRAASAFRAKVFEEVLESLKSDYPQATFNASRSRHDGAWVLTCKEPDLSITYAFWDVSRDDIALTKTDDLVILADFIVITGAFKSKSLKQHLSTAVRDQMARRQALDALESADFPDFFDKAKLNRLISKLPEAIRTTPETKGYDHYLDIFQVLWPRSLTRNQVSTLNSNQHVQFLRNWFIAAVDGMFEVTSYNPNDSLATLRKGEYEDWVPAGDVDHKAHYIESMMSPKLTDVAAASVIYPARLFTCE